MSAQREETGLDWPILKRWDVPWEWQTVSLTLFACGLSFVFDRIGRGSLDTIYLGLCIEELSLDEKVEILFMDQGITTTVVLAVLYGISNTFQPLPDDFFRYDLKEPFSLKKGWFLWAGIGLVSALIAVRLTGMPCPL